MLVAGIIVLVAAFAPTSANAVITNSALVPAGPGTFDLSCTGRDPTTNQILSGIPALGNPIHLPGNQITTNAIPSPADGEQFSLDFTWQFVLPQVLAKLAVTLHNTEIDQLNSVLPIHAQSGATGADFQGHPADIALDLGDGSVAIPYTQPQAGEPPLTGTFTRSGTGNAVEFVPGMVQTDAATANATLKLICTPTNVKPLVLNDKAGPPPPSTTVPPTTAPPPAPPTTAAAVSASSATATDATSGTALARTGFHAELLYLGIALLGAGYALSLFGRRVARASARST
jgi:hypothetical protein